MMVEMAAPARALALPVLAAVVVPDQAAQVVMVQMGAAARELAALAARPMVVRVEMGPMVQMAVLVRNLAVEVPVVETETAMAAQEQTVRS